MTHPALGLASAKVLLLGEHAVVYDQPALAVGIPRGVRAQVSSAPSPGPCILRVPAWGIDLRADGAAGQAAGVALALRAILDALSLSGDGLCVDIDAHIPAGVGLGSSASLAVAITRALCAWADLPLDFPTLDRVCMAAERVFHGSPSGIDHSVAAVGGVVRFRRSAAGPQIEPLTLTAPLRLVVGVAAPGASTAAQVGGVAARLARHPEAIRPVIDAIGVLVERGVAALLRADWDALGELMNINHGLLCALGVSTSALDAAAHVARAEGALGAKLTGAGGGGCVVALTPTPDLQARVAAALRPICQDVLCPTL
jgi:mevalonate kinase